MKYWSYVLHSCLVNFLGILLISSLHIWNFAIWLVAPLFFYWVSMFLTTVRVGERSTRTSAFVAASLLAGHILELIFALTITALLGKEIGTWLTGGVNLMELFFTNSANSFLFGSLIATLGSFLLVQFYFSQGPSRA